MLTPLWAQQQASGDEVRPRRMLRLFIEIEDGDTVVYMGRHLRFLGVDTPEIRNPSLGFWKDQPYGPEAKEYTRRQIEEARRLTYVSDGEDRYGRLLVHLFVDGYPLSVRIIEAGLGYAIVPSIDVALHRGRGLAAVPLRAPRLSCTYGLVTRRGMPLSPPAARLRALLVDEMKAKGGLHALSA